MSKKQPELLTTSAITKDNSLRARAEHWFEYLVKVQPHHTDYGGVVWHGTYLTWMESARVECLNSIGVNFSDLVKLGCDLPVVELSIKYRRPLRLGDAAIVKTRLVDTQGVRMIWDYEIKSTDDRELYLTATVSLVPIDREKGKIMRKLPPSIKDALLKLANKYLSPNNE